MVILNRLPPELLTNVFKYTPNNKLAELRNLIIDVDAPVLLDCIDAALFDKIAIAKNLDQREPRIKNLPFFITTLPETSEISGVFDDGSTEVTCLASDFFKDNKSMDHVGKYVKRIHLYQTRYIRYDKHEMESLVRFINSAMQLQSIRASIPISGITKKLTEMEIVVDAAENMLSDGLDSLKFLKLFNYPVLASELSPSEYDFSKLKRLELCYCVQNFDGSTWKLSNLKELAITFATGIAPGVTSNMVSKNFPKLKKLSLKHGTIETIGTTDLVSLELSDMQIIPSTLDFHNITNLEELKLKRLGLPSIPNLKYLKNLNSLEITSEWGIVQLGKLPNLPKLTHLNLSDNKISSVVTGFSHLPKLIELNLHNNELDSLKGLDDISSLIKLDVSRNKISSIIPLNCPKLVNLNLEGNKLTSLNGLEILLSITKLNVKQNNISDISDLSLHSLREFDISHNPVSNLRHLADFPALRSLDLCGVPVKNFENLGDIGKLRNLKSLSLFENEIPAVENFSLNYSLRSATKIEKFNAELKFEFDKLFGNNNELVISCLLGEATKSTVFSNLLMEIKRKEKSKKSR
ncbi:hypothetical protein DASC09_063860 [Saccharomycopsis crataegensis]|uniref:Uncharacterized protein n=1 Tax=Saccharomycopsis crataegensis TaxID=43959 RepID=A0AAV5QWW3_9ASCO|nr:hypothetical protein DASC09_063860 [Saccharomycopsis crataegensis]